MDVDTEPSNKLEDGDVNFRDEHQVKHEEIDTEENQSNNQDFTFETIGNGNVKRENNEDSHAKFSNGIDRNHLDSKTASLSSIGDWNKEETFQPESFDTDKDCSVEPHVQVPYKINKNGYEMPLPNEVGHTCKICNKHFKYTGNLETHLQKHLQTYIGKEAIKRNESSSVKDEPYSETHTVPDELASIEDALNAIIDSSNSCGICNKFFGTTRQYRKHMAIHSTEKRHKCDLCDKSFSVPSKLHRHKLSHTGDKPHLCVICSKQFSTADNLKKHNLIHSGEKAFTCDRCSRQFTQAVNLKEHLQTHLLEKQWVCEICTATFKTTVSLRKHMQRHAGLKNHLCEICSKPFAEASKLKIHKLTHSGEKNYSCSFCGMKFTTSGNMRRHELTHSGEKPHACSVCNKTFAQAGNMRTHMLTHNKPLTKNAQRKMARDKIVEQKDLDSKEERSENALSVGFSNDDSRSSLEVLNESDNEQIGASTNRTKRKGIASVDKSCLKLLFKRQRKCKTNKNIETLSEADPCDDMISLEQLELDIKVESGETDSGKEQVNEIHEKNGDDVTRKGKKSYNDVSIREPSDDTKTDSGCLDKIHSEDDMKTDIANAKKNMANLNGDMLFECSNNLPKFDNASTSIKYPDMMSEKGYVILLNENSKNGDGSDNFCIANPQEQAEMHYETSTSSSNESRNSKYYEEISNDSVDTGFSGETIEIDQSEPSESIDDNSYSLLPNKEDRVVYDKLSNVTDSVARFSNEDNENSDAEHVGIQENGTPNKPVTHQANDVVKEIDHIETTDILNKMDELLFTDISSKTKEIPNIGLRYIEKLPKAEVSTIKGLSACTGFQNEESSIKTGEFSIKTMEKMEAELHKDSRDNLKNKVDKDLNSEIVVSNKTDSTIHTDEKDLTCKICTQEFVDAEDLKKHLYRHIETNTKPSLTCQVCDSAFPDQHGLTEHLLNDHKSDDPNTCVICKKEYATPRKYKKHMLCHVVNKRYMCELCSKSCPSPSKLQRHLLSHTGQKPHLCVICSRQFSTASNLKKHNLIHSGDKLYTCDRCCKRFSQAGNLKEHMLTHSEQKQWSCEICQAEFKTSARLKTHMRLVHIGHKRHSCEICSKSFNQPSKLRRHMRSHTGERPFVCSVCDMAFTTPGNLKKHGPIHTGRKPFSCQLCSRAFAQSGNLKSHMLTHKKEK